MYCTRPLYSTRKQQVGLSDVYGILQGCCGAPGIAECRFTRARVSAGYTDSPQATVSIPLQFKADSVVRDFSACGDKKVPKDSSILPLRSSLEDIHSIIQGSLL